MDAHERFSTVDTSKCDGTSTSGIQLSTKIAEASHSEDISRTYNAKCEQFISSTKVQNQSSSSIMDEYQRLPAIDNGNQDGMPISGIQPSTMIVEPSCSKDMSLKGLNGTAWHIVRTTLPTLRALWIDGNAKYDGTSTLGIQLSNKVVGSFYPEDIASKAHNGTALTYKEKLGDFQ